MIWKSRGDEEAVVDDAKDERVNMFGHCAKREQGSRRELAQDRDDNLP
jgi:hypothetical protein